MKTKIINLTPHEINIVGEKKYGRWNIISHHFEKEAQSDTPCHHCGTWRDEGNDIPCRITIPPSGIIARVEEKVSLHAIIGNIPIIHKSFGQVTGLPEEEKDTYYIVSLVVAQTIGGQRKDILTIGEVVRNDKGQVVGAKSLAVV